MLEKSPKFMVENGFFDITNLHLHIIFNVSKSNVFLKILKKDLSILHISVNAKKCFIKIYEVHSEKSANVIFLLSGCR